MAFDFNLVFGTCFCYCDYKSVDLSGFVLQIHMF